MTEQEIDNHRHTGTDSQRVSYNDLLDKPTAGAWEVIHEVKLTTTGTTLIDTSDIGSISTDYDLFRITIHAIAGASAVIPYIEFNGDTGTNYDFIRTRDAAAVARNVDTAASNILLQYGTLAAGETGTYAYTIGKSASDKHAKVIGHVSYYDLDLSSIARSDVAGTWRNTSSKITRIVIATTANQFGANSTALIEGYKG